MQGLVFLSMPLLPVSTLPLDLITTSAMPGRGGDQLIERLQAIGRTLQPAE
jgi:hypothetical protein